MHLDDGTQVEGRLAKTVEGWKVTQADGAVITIKSDRVLSIEAGKSAGAGAAADRLASLRRAVDHLSDARQVVDRYQKFLEQNTDPAVLEEAGRDLAVWQQRLDQGLVKVGSQWVSTQERDRLRQVAQTEAQSAARSAQPESSQGCPGGDRAIGSRRPHQRRRLFLQGVILYKQEQITPALKAFESANQFQASDAATLNNLGVINWRQKSPVAALSFYDQAMLARPMDRQILDNVAEALHALPPENAKAPAALKAARDFQDQDSQLQQTLAKDGQYRWGSTWVTAKQLDDLKLAENRVKERVDNLARDYDALQAKVGEIDAEVDANNREMHRLQASVTYVDTNGRSSSFRFPAPITICRMTTSSWPPTARPCRPSRKT